MLFAISYSRSRINRQSNFSWQKDPLCEGKPYPKVFSEFKKTLSNLRSQKYGNAPCNGKEVLEQIERDFDLGYSLLRNNDGELLKLLDDVVITDTFENCIFSSSKSISLIKEFTEETTRFFILDGTFRITPKGVWQQILILHVNFGLKVSKVILLIRDHEMK